MRSLTSVSETIRKPPLLKTLTALKTIKQNMAKNDRDQRVTTYINLHKLFTLHCNFICVLSVVIIKTDDDEDDDD